MIVLLSPSKGQDFDMAAPIGTFSQPQLLSESEQLVDELRQYNSQQIQKMMAVSENIAELNVTRYQQFKTPFDAQNAKQALFAFKGDVYTGLAADTLSAEDCAFAQQHVRILSGLYGRLKPLDLIQPYRLEMKTRLKNPRGANLYQFWGERIARQLDQDAQDANAGVILNLASQEYFKAVQSEQLQTPVITVHFKEVRDGQSRVIGLFAKKARGDMANYIVTQRIAKIEDVQKYNRGGYVFKPQLSDNNNWVFERPQPAPVNSCLLYTSPSPRD